MQASAHPSKTLIFFFRFSDGRISQVTSIPCGPASITAGFSARHDGRAFVWTQNEQAANLMLIENFR